MNLSQQYNVNNEERLLGLFSHLSIFFGGIILPLIFWAINKEKSKFVTFHSLQALFFHIAYAFLIIVLVFGFIIGGAGFSLLTAGLHSTAKGGGSFIFVFVIIALYIFLFLIIFAVIGYSIYMAIKAYNGELKKYPIIGNIVYKKIYGTGT
jgi:uncharacterized Tic20 family protein